MTKSHLEVFGKIIYCRILSDRREEFFGSEGYSADGLGLYYMVHPQEVQEIVDEIQKRLDTEIAPDLEWDRKIAEEPDERRQAQLRIMKNASKIKW